MGLTAEAATLFSNMDEFFNVLDLEKVFSQR